MKKLFENVGGNQFKLIKESDWRTTQEHNGNINDGRKVLRAQAQYITAASQSPYADEEVKKVAANALKDIETLDKIMTKGYLDSGYQYDDNDPRNQADLHGDRMQDENPARTGSSKEDEIEAEIRHQVAQRHLDDHMRYYNEFFSDELAETLWPTPSEQSQDLFGRRGEAMGLSSHMSELMSIWQDTQGDDDHGM